MEQKYTVWRNYYKHNIPIYGGVQEIHEKILSNKNQSKSYNQADADLLTKFFQEYKNIIKSQNKTIGDYLTIELLETEVKVPFINFKQSGAKFEPYLQTLVQKGFDAAVAKTSDTKGGQTANVYLELGSLGKNETEEEFLQKILGDSVEQILHDTSMSIIGEVEKENNVTTYYLKVGASRSGKIDIQGKEGVGVDIEIKGKASAELERVISILQNASFSVKSYASNSSIHLGQTKNVKAISAIATYVGSLWAKGSALYYIKYQNPTPQDGESSGEIQEIYKHYDHMKKIYELTGLGLSYEDIKDLENTDFLLVNRTSRDDIKVFSTKALIEEFYDLGHFNIKV